MNLITYDFETYYDTDYSLSKMTTEEYIRHELFEVIGVSVKVNGAPARWFSGTREETGGWLRQFDWVNSMAVAHNNMFDGAILSWIFDIHPRVLADTLSMARPIHGTTVGGSLAKLVQHYGLGEKGTEVINAKGKRRLDFSVEELHAYGRYCINDTELTYKLFLLLAEGFPKEELKLIDLTLKMFTEPVLELDQLKLEQHMKDVLARKAELMERLGGDSEEARKVLMSNPKFAKLLQKLGVEPPMKVSPTTKQYTYAFAKTDPGMKALLEHPNEDVQAVVAARLGVKTTLEETRTQRFIDIANRGKLPVPLSYFAAHTGRWGGADKINFQNLPSRGANAGKLKSAICAPEGYVIIDSDSSQIEARMLAWMAGQQDLVEAFQKNDAEKLAKVPEEEQQWDVYKIMASNIYNKPIGQITKPERFVGKSTILGCFGPDTKVLTSGGWKCIVEVQSTDTLWDGEEWVTHKGVVPKGVRETIRSWGVDATPEHEILTEHGWREWQEVITNPSLSQSAFAKGRSLFFGGSSITNPLGGLPGGIPSYDVIADGKGRLTGTISEQSAPLAATLAGVLQDTQNGTGSTNLYSRMKATGRDFSTASRRVYRVAITCAQRLFRIMEGGGLLCIKNGERTVPCFSGTFSHSPDGTTQNGTLTGLTTTKVTNRVIYDLPQEVKTQGIKGPSEYCRRKLQTYDIGYAGPRNRFIIATDAGPLTVHNCGYGMGAGKFQATMKTFGVEIDGNMAQYIIDTYRNTYPKVPWLWGNGERCLEALLVGAGCDYGVTGVVQVGFGLVHTPMGLAFRYPGLRKNTTSVSLTNSMFIYDSRAGVTSIWGGKFTENVIQHLARVVIGQQMLRIAKRYRVVMTVHDAIGVVAPVKEQEEAQAYIEECMRWVPPWATGLPLNCESGVGSNYGEC